MCLETESWCYKWFRCVCLHECVYVCIDCGCTGAGYNSVSIFQYSDMFLGEDLEKEMTDVSIT